MLTKEKATAHFLNHGFSLTQLAEIVLYIDTSGLFRLLLENAKVQHVDEKNPNFQSLSMAEAHRSFGYMQALDDILNFKNKYLVDAPNISPSLVPDFGATKSLLKKNLISKEEADELSKRSVS